MKKSNSICINCNSKGHEKKNCPEPIVSLGIILLKDIDSINIEKIFDKNNDKTINMDELKINNINDYKILYKFRNKIKFLMIERKHTLGYIEFIRGRYLPNNYESIIYLFNQMTQKEIKNIGMKKFDILWDEFWNDKYKKTIYENEYNLAKKRFNELEKNKLFNLEYYTKNVKPLWDNNEWGFPKGRRNKCENKLDCAIREFREETAFYENDFKVLNKYTPFIEEFIGTNGIRYKHIYYIGYATNNKIPIIEPYNKIQNNEIGDIKYFTYDEALIKIRPYHKDRINILTKLFNHIINKLIEIN